MIIDSVDVNQRVLIIAEIGNNHEGSIELAEDMIGLAADAGVDAVKFQSINPGRLVAASDTARIAQLEKFRLTPEQFEHLSAAATKAGLAFLSTPFDESAVEYLEPLVPAFKIASGDNDCVPLLQAVAATGKPVIMSTGLARTDDIRNACNVIERVWQKNSIVQEIALLHCVVSYPTSIENAQLSNIRNLQSLSRVTGYSDHTTGIDAAVLSIGLGARIVEKHFTISNTHSDFRDHQLSANPKDMTEMVRRIREAELLLGNGLDEISEAEESNRRAVRRGLYAARNVSTGSTITPDDLCCLRPMDGIPAAEYSNILGQTLHKPLTAGAPLSWSHIRK